MNRAGLSLFLQHPVNCAFFSCSPPAVSCAYMRLLGRIWFRTNPLAQERYVRPLREILGEGKQPLDSVDGAASRMLHGVMEHYYEKLLTAYWGFSRMRRMLLERVTVVHGDLLDAGLERGRGVILTTAHFGAVEFLPAALAFRGYPVTMAVRYGTPRLKRTLESLAAAAGIELLDTESGAVLPRALSSLRRGRIFIFELDEISSWKPSPRKVMTLFGRQVRLDRTVEILQKRTGSPLLMGLMERVGRRRYQLVFEKPCEHDPAPTGLGEDAQLLKRLEHYIYTYPEHWYQWKDIGLLDQMAPS